MKALLAAGLRRGVRRLRRAARARPRHPGPRRRRQAKIHIGIDWLASVSFGHVTSDRQARHRARRRQHRDGLLPLGAPLGADDVKVIVRCGFEEMKASPWEKEDAMHEGIPIINCHVPQGLRARRRPADRHDASRSSRRSTTTRASAAWCPPASPTSIFACDEVLVAVGQENAFPWIERDSGIEFDEWGMPVLDAGHVPGYRCRTSSSAATPRSGPRTSSPRWPTATRRRCRSTACCTARTSSDRPPPHVNLMSQKMGIHEWSYDNAPSNDLRFKVPWAKAEKALASIKVEVELGFDARDRVQGSAALPELRRADGVRRQAVHRVRRLRRHLPDGLHHLHRQRRRGRPAHAAEGAGAPTRAGPLRQRAAEDRHA